MMKHALAMAIFFVVTNVFASFLPTNSVINKKCGKNIYNTKVEEVCFAELSDDPSLNVVIIKYKDNTIEHFIVYEKYEPKEAPMKFSQAMQIVEGVFEVQDENGYTVFKDMIRDVRSGGKNALITFEREMSRSYLMNLNDGSVPPFETKNLQ